VAESSSFNQEAGPTAIAEGSNLLVSRESSYFWQDQLRHSDAVKDFRSIKHLLNTVASFEVGQVFEFATHPVHIGQSTLGTRP
jgi:hypothetical protein